MYSVELVFAQLMDHSPAHTLRRCVEGYRGHYKVKRFSCIDQYRCMAFAQLTYRESLLDLRGPIPAFIHITDGRVHDVNVLDLLLPEAGAFYIMDRGYIHFERLYIKRLDIPHPLYTILQILSVTVFERMPLYQVLSDVDYALHEHESNNQLNLFN